MEYVIKYNTEINRQEANKEKWTSKARKKIKKHRLIAIIGCTLITLIAIDIMMVTQFIALLTINNY